jgi:hypothetical protein
MKFSSFLSKLFVHSVLWFFFIESVLTGRTGTENLIVFYAGMSSVMSIISMFASGGLRTIDVPGSLIGRVLWNIFHLSGMLFAVALIEHGHFISATALVAWLGLKWGAYREARRFERQMKAMLKEAAQRFDEFDEQVRASKEAEQPDFGKKTTAPVKVNPNAARDPAFGYPFTPSDIAATSA